MKTRFASKTKIALAVAIAAAAAYESLANEQPIPPPTTASALPESISPNSPVAQVVKLAQAGVDAGVIQNYITNCPNAFNLDADKIIALTDAGVSAEMVNAMLAHDKNYLAALAAAAPPAPASPSATPVASTDNNAPAAATAPPTEMTANDFNATLAPYGQWVEVAGYGRCWRPTTVVYDATWQPYCDRGRWVYTDCGWYWNSDYAWGVTFHYGRWFNTPNYGWCWWPDTVWAPSWVTWRSCNDYCGWAPLPPYTAYQTGVGFTYHGGNVAVSFGFGLAANCYTFVSIGNFCQPHPRSYCVPQHQVTQIYNQTTIINNYNSNNRTIVNNGVSVTTIGAAAHHPIQPVSIGTLVNPGRHGGHGQAENHPAQPLGANTSDASATHPFTGGGFHHGGATHNDTGNLTGGNHPSPTVQNSPVAQFPSNQHGQRDSGLTRGNMNSPVQPAPAHTNPANNPAPVRSPSHSGGFVTGGDNHQTARPYSPPVGMNPSPVRPTVSGNGNGSPSPIAQHPSAPANFREPTQLVNSSPVRSAPPVVAERPQRSAPPVVAERPQRSDPRQNFIQPAPRNFTPAAPTLSSPSPTQNASPNNGGRFQQSWLVRNH